MRMPIFSSRIKILGSQVKTLPASACMSGEGLNCSGKKMIVYIYIDDVYQQNDFVTLNPL